MRITSKILFCIVLFAVTLNALEAISSEADSLQSSLSTEEIFLLKSPWSGSENAAGLQFLAIPKRIGKVELFYNNNKGDYHRFLNGKENLQYGFYTNGYTKLKNWKFYGDFSYYSDIEKNVKWVDVMEPYNDNPYTLGDDMGGKYIKEYFDMNAKASWHASEKLDFGFEVNYLTGVGTRRKDPRPVNETTSFKIKPGVIYNLNRFKLGLNLNFQTGKEDMEIQLVGDSTFTYYHFKGLGTFTSTTDKGERSHESIVLGGGLQFGYNGSSFQNTTEVSFFQKETDIKRGVSVPLQVVLLEKFQTEVSSVFLFKPEEKNINKLTLNFTDKHIYGHEPVIEPTQVQENFQWSTVAKYLLYWHQENSVRVNYDFFKLQDNNHFNWGTSVGGQIYTSETSYYFVPERNYQELNYFLLHAALKKELITSFADVVFEMNGKYRKGFKSTYQIVDEETLLETVNSDFVETDYNYFNSAMSEAGANLALGKKIKIYQEWMQLYLSAGYNIQFSQMPDNPTRNYFNLQFGINF